MNAAIKRRWVKALRSGKYKQGRGLLKQGDEFCCLGVLCDLHSSAMGVPTLRWTKFDLYGREGFVLPKRVVKWAELEGTNPEFDTEEDITMVLAELNDSGQTFIQIADLIEKYL